MALGIGHQHAGQRADLAGFAVVPRGFEPGVFAVPRPVLRIFLQRFGFTLVRMSGRPVLVPAAGDIFRNPCLVCHFDAGEIAFHDDAPGHKETVRLLIRFRKLTPGQEVAGSADGAPVFVERSDRQQIRNIDVFNEILGFFGDIQKFGNTIRR